MDRTPSDLQGGDCFAFRGLTDAEPDGQVVIVIKEMSLSGNVIAWVFEDGKKKNNTMSTSLCDIMEMIRQGAWQFVGKKEHVLDQDSLKKVS